MESFAYFLLKRQFHEIFCIPFLVKTAWLLKLPQADQTGSNTWREKLQRVGNLHLKWGAPHAIPQLYPHNAHAIPSYQKTVLLLSHPIISSYYPHTIPSYPLNYPQLSPSYSHAIPSDPQTVLPLSLPIKYPWYPHTIPMLSPSTHYPTPLYPYVIPMLSPHSTPSYPQAVLPLFLPIFPCYPSSYPQLPTHYPPAIPPVIPLCYPHVIPMLSA